MIKASQQNRKQFVDILTQAFDNNISVNYVVAQDRHRVQRIRRLMEYSFDLCYRFGRVFLSDDHKACALVLLPDQKRFTLYTGWLDLKLALWSIGPGNLRKVMAREARINQVRQDKSIYYLWFIGVAPASQHQGAGKGLLQEIMADSRALQRSVYLETSVPSNVSWYQRQGFDIYHEMKGDYTLYFMRK
jgi:ribosomal protein S18 acetylase RimI-like enzyme